ncbi:MAG TPA: TfuA-like protein, partial [Acetobacteraceae bacterium]|nr:TfuA-like protein [Acetobacteraceae bacterium]
MTAVVFLGPTLPRADALAILPSARILPPARQGDVFRAVRALRPSSIGLVDGAFLDVPAVWHREILWALEQDVRVLGAASMGALRAAELHGFGMQGVGAVFAAYRDGVLPGWDGGFEDDDEVAVVHAPAELGFAPLSDAMVDLRATLARAEAAQVIGRKARDALAAAMKQLHFPQRSLDCLAEAAVASGEAALASWLREHHRSLKAEDARLLLGALSEAPPGPLPRFHRERALVWERFVAGAALDEADEAVLAALRRDPIAWRETALAGSGRLALLDGAETASPDAATLSRFRTARDLWMRADLDEWMRANGTDAAGLGRLLGEEGVIER